MKNIPITVAIVSILLITGCQQEKIEVFTTEHINTLYRAAPEGVETRWSSPENIHAERGKGAQFNKGAKGKAFFVLAPGEKKVIFDQKGTGLITRIWLTGTMILTKEARREMTIEMFWDDAKKPAVSAPLTDFFGVGLGETAAFQSALFSQPEGRSFNSYVPMPYRMAARIEITNGSEFHTMLYYDVDFVKVSKHPDDVLYFHAYWSRDLKTQLGKDFEILPKVSGRGRYLGTNIGVIGNPDYKGTWFGEGEVKIYLDGDSDYPTLAGTGTEDYIGSGWGQAIYGEQYQGSLISNKQNYLYAFYRYHIPDPVYFHKKCKVTLQQIGNAQKPKIEEMLKNGIELQPVSHFIFDRFPEISTAPIFNSLLSMENPPTLDEVGSETGINFYRRDDVSATAYFYLDKPSSNLPTLPSKELRLKDLKERVYSVTQNVSTQM
ncbi:glycoside hydrolase family 172 protein [Flagellimonas onchidii]|uniref:glycoside hydrolase family 172 protein n=1 Tax=Flagellimonas onchidii TaxID=2562684 RepID=UPI0010A64ECB|nr:glycoside hydrolase family 172 protein [Allomuricauda onchidii]